MLSDCQGTNYSVLRSLSYIWTATEELQHPKMFTDGLNLFLCFWDHLQNSYPFWTLRVRSTGSSYTLPRSKTCLPSLSLLQVRKLFAVAYHKDNENISKRLYLSMFLNVVFWKEYSRHWLKFSLVVQETKVLYQRWRMTGVVILLLRTSYLQF